MECTIHGKAFIKVHNIKTESDFALVSSDDGTFDFDLNPVSNITKPSKSACCISRLVEKKREYNSSASLSSVTTLKELIALEKELSGPPHPHINDTGCSGIKEGVNPGDVTDAAAVSPHDTHGAGFVTPHKLRQEVNFTDEALCDKHVAWSMSLGARIIGEFHKSQSLSYLSVCHHTSQMIQTLQLETSEFIMCDY